MPFTHVTGIILMRRGEAVAPHVLNFGTTTEAARMRVFADRAGGVTLADSGDVKVPPRGTTAMSHTLAASEDLWVEIETTSESLVPTCYFARPAASGFEIVALFRGAEFAVFDPAGKRLW